MKTTIINVASDFSRYPGGRCRQHSRYSGEAFRDDHLVPSLNKNERVIVDLEGVVGYPPSFLEEAFGGLVRVHKIASADLLERLVFKGSRAGVRETIRRFIAEAGNGEGT